jgi:hypothetical protein
MKKTMLVLFLALVIVAMSSVAAFAAGYTTDTLDATQAAHGGYGATTHACKQCHDVHGNDLAAAATDWAPLYRWATKSAGCEACHLGASADATGYLVYTAAVAVDAEHTLTVTAVPDGTTDLAAGLACSDCHDGSPHGQGWYDPITPTFGTAGAMITATDVVTYCGACHDLNDDGAGDSTHPLATDIATSGRSISITDATDCKSCHVTTMANGFPHQSVTDYAFLGSATAAADANLDGVCIACHDNVGTAY